MFLEDPQIDLPYSCHAMTRSWLVHGFADQGARLYVGDTLASPSTLFHIDHHADHTHPESEARVGNLAHCAFSSAISGNVRIFGGNPLIWNYQFYCIPFCQECLLQRVQGQGKRIWKLRGFSVKVVESFATRSLLHHWRTRHGYACALIVAGAFCHVD